MRFWREKRGRRFFVGSLEYGKKAGITVRLVRLEEIKKGVSFFLSTKNTFTRQIFHKTHSVEIFVPHIKSHSTHETHLIQNMHSITRNIHSI